MTRIRGEDEKGETEEDKFEPEVDQCCVKCGRVSLDYRRATLL